MHMELDLETRFRDTGYFTIPKVKGLGKKLFAYVKLTVESHLLDIIDF